MAENVVSRILLFAVAHSSREATMRVRIEPPDAVANPKGLFLR
jgi:hypothetical protein